MQSAEDKKLQTTIITYLVSGQLTIHQLNSLGYSPDSTEAREWHDIFQQQLLDMPEIDQNAVIAVSESDTGAEICERAVDIMEDIEYHKRSKVSPDKREDLFVSLEESISYAVGILDAAYTMEFGREEWVQH